MLTPTALRCHPRSCTSLLLIASALVVATRPLSADDGEGPKTLRRRLDHVVVTGPPLAPVLGSPIAKLRLLALRRGALEVVPFQVDERTPSGQYAYRLGSDTKRDTDKEHIDANDELVFMARDTGGKAHPRRFSGLGKVCEVEVKEPGKDAHGYAYLVAYKGAPPPLSKTDYVSVEYSESGLFRYAGAGFALDNKRAPGNAIRTSSIRFEDRSGKLGRNVVDTTQSRTEVHYFAIPIRRNGTEMRVTIGAWIDGPVRVVALNLVEIYLIWGFWVRAPDSLIYLYDYGSEMPTSFEIPVNIDNSPMSSARLSLDLAQDNKEWFFYSDRNPSPLAIDGRMGPAEQRLDRSFPDWMVAYGPEGGVIRRLIFETPKFKGLPNSALHYQDERTRLDPPEYEPGCFGNSGFRIDLAGCKTGVYRGYYYSYYKARFRYGDERRYLQIVDAPLELTVRAVPQRP